MDLRAACGWLGRFDEGYYMCYSGYSGKGVAMTYMGEMSTGEVAACLGMSRQAVLNLIERGHVRARKMSLQRNSPYRVDRTSVEEFLKLRDEQTRKG